MLRENHVVITRGGRNFHELLAHYQVKSVNKKSPACAGLFCETITELDQSSSP